ncbi:MAG: hypothetical protein LBB09_01130, partial [Rickettsiales bacterium]|jgi:hypothetical protein|nr:hypothetical protein [Rickettsiales bacterium]
VEITFFLSQKTISEEDNLDYESNVSYEFYAGIADLSFSETILPKLRKTTCDNESCSIDLNATKDGAKYDNFSYDEGLANFKEDFDNYFMKFFDLKIESVSNDLCNNIYAKYFEKLDSFNSQNTAAPLKNGFYMLAKCTPKGWVINGQVSCKKRCRIAEELGLDPDGVGKWDVNIFLYDVRHNTLNTTIEVAGHRGNGAACSVGANKSGGLIVYRRSQMKYSCNNGTSSVSYDQGGDEQGKRDGYTFWWPSDRSGCVNGKGWNICFCTYYCSGTFSAFGSSTTSTADKLCFKIRNDNESNKNSFIWGDTWDETAAVLCPGRSLKLKKDGKIECDDRYDKTTKVVYYVENVSGDCRGHGPNSIAKSQRWALETVCPTEIISTYPTEINAIFFPYCFEDTLDKNAEENKKFCELHETRCEEKPAAVAN